MYFVGPAAEIGESRHPMIGNFFRTHKKTILIVVVLWSLGVGVRYLVVSNWGIRLSPEKFMEKVDSVGSPMSLASYEFDGEREGRIYISAWEMHGFPERFHYWIEGDKLTEEQRLEVERRMVEGKREKSKREGPKR